VTPWTRLVSAYKAFVKPGELTAATVRPYEAQDTFGRRRQRDHFDLASRYLGYVKVASSRTSSAVASSELKLYRRVSSRRPDTAFETKRLSAGERKRIANDRHSSPLVKSMVEANGDVEEITDIDHPVKQVLSTANPHMSGFDLFEYTEMLQGLAGSFYWIAVRGRNGWPVEVWPGFPQYMRPIGSRETLVDYYIYGRGMEVEMRIDRENVVPFRRPNPVGNPYYGVSDLAACLVEADLSAAFARFALTSLDRGVQPGLMVLMPNMSRLQKEELEADLRRTADGTRNGQRSLVVTGPAGMIEKAKIERWESAAKEAGYLAGQSEDTVLRRIAACFDIPVTLITMEESSVANGRVAAPHWQLMSIMPKCRRIEQTLNERFLPMFGSLANGLFLRYENPIDEDRDLAMTLATRGYQGGVLSLNEAREEVELPPVGDGDSKFIDKSGGDKPGNDQPDKTTPALTDDSKSLDCVVLVKSAAPPTPEPTNVLLQSKGFGCACRDKHEPRGSKAVKGTAVGHIAEAVAFWIEAQTGIVIDSIGPGGAFAVSLDTPESRRLFMDAVGSLIDAVFSDEYGGSISAGPGLPKSDPNPYFDANRARTFDSVSRTATDSIMRELTESARMGETPNQMRDRVLAVSDNLQNHQAEAIARTEVSKAQNRAREAAWTTNGNVAAKEWLLAPGACPVCKAIRQARPTAPLGQPFFKKGSSISVDGKTYVFDYEDVYGPPAHPNDRCSLGAVFKPTGGST